MDFNNDELIYGVTSGDTRAIARLITLSENRIQRAQEIQTKLFKKTGNAHVVGVTGSPGAGKSTLVDELARAWKREGKRVAVIAVDPTSPYSGGALLGDRIRMMRSLEEEGIFVRSMATRGSLGGLSLATMDAIYVLDAAGFDIILVETVGVGQGEVDIVRTADTCLVLLVPGMGDDVQAIKAGILEIADIFVVNKSDRDGADSVEKDLRLLLSLERFSEQEWEPKINRTIASTGDGVKELIVAIEEHTNWLKESPAGEERRKEIFRSSLLKIASSTTTFNIEQSLGAELEDLSLSCLRRETAPHVAAIKLLKLLK